MEDTQSTVLSSSDPTVISFTGIASAKNLDGTRVQLNWPAASSTQYSKLRISRVNADGSLVTLQTTPIGQTTYIDTGLTPSTLYSYMVQALDSDGNPDSNQVVASAFTYAGATQPTSTILPTSSTLTFPTPGAATNGAHVYCKTATGPDTLLGTATALASSFPLTNLISGTTYSCHVQAVVAATGLEDNNTAVATFQTTSLALSGAYQGVILVQAYGDVGQNLKNQSRTAATAIFPFPISPQVSITWKNFTMISSPGAASYRLVRTLKGGAFNMNTTTSCTPTTTTACQVCLNSPSTVNGTTISQTTYSRTCQDVLIGASPVQYDYAVSLIVDSSVTPPLAEELPAAPIGDTNYRITVPIPPSNMVLVHRDSVNYEMCTNYLNKPPVPTAHQSCAYTGTTGPNGTALGGQPTSSNVQGTSLSTTVTPGTYDFGYNLFIDRWQEGCNWTPLTGGGDCGTGGSPGDCNGALGYSATSIYQQGSLLGLHAATPPKPPASTVGANGNVFYAYDSATCWYKDPSQGWISNSIWSYNSSSNVYYNSGIESSSSPYYASIGTPAADPVNQRPPLLGTPAFAYKVCQAQTTGYGPKRLIRRREFVAASAFQILNGEPNQASAARVNNIISGGAVGLPNSYVSASSSNAQACAASTTINQGVTHEFLSSSYYGVPLGPFNASPYNGIPAVVDSSGTGIGTLVSTPLTSELATYVNDAYLVNPGFNIGSVSTQNCTSRFGAQDLIGNGAMWLADQFNCNPSSHICSGQPTSSFDQGDTDMATFRFDGNQGPGGTRLNDVSYGPTPAASPNTFGHDLDYTAYSGITFSGTLISAQTRASLYIGNSASYGNVNYISAPLGLPMVGSDGGAAVSYTTVMSNPNNQISPASAMNNTTALYLYHGANATLDTDVNPVGFIRQMSTATTYFAPAVPTRFSLDITFANQTDGYGNPLEGSPNQNSTNANAVVRCAVPAE